MTNGGGHESIPKRVNINEKQSDDIAGAKKTATAELSTQDKHKH